MKKFPAQPLHDRVIVESDPAQDVSAGGIIIPDTAKEKPQRGTVKAVGPGIKGQPTTVKPGDTVMYGKFSGTEIELGDDKKKYLIMRETDLLAIV